MSVIDGTLGRLQHFYRSGPLPCPYLPGRVERKLFTRLNGGDARALNTTLSQALAGIVLVPIFAYILLLSNNSKIMRTTNSRFENFWLGCAVTGMFISNLLFFWFLIK